LRVAVIAGLRGQRRAFPIARLDLNLTLRTVVDVRPLAAVDDQLEQLGFRVGDDVLRRERLEVAKMGLVLAVLGDVP
jgi:hypothetical protein